MVKTLWPILKYCFVTGAWVGTLVGLVEADIPDSVWRPLVAILFGIILSLLGLGYRDWVGKLKEFRLAFQEHKDEWKRQHKEVVDEVKQMRDEMRTRNRKLAVQVVFALMPRDKPLTEEELLKRFESSLEE